jgi:hypothetical protein
METLRALIDQMQAVGQDADRSAMLRKTGPRCCLPRI